MGLHFPLEYTGYETTFLHTFIDLLDNFCNRCHTNDDVHNDCRLCPMGHLIYTSKEYILSAYESKILDKETRIIRCIKKKIKKIEPTPHFNGGWVFDKCRNKDILLELRELLKDLQFLNMQRIRPFTMSQGIEEQTFGEISKKVELSMKKLENKFRK